MVLEMTVSMETSDVFTFTPIPVESNRAASKVPPSLDHVPASCSCPDSWTWNWNDRSPEADLSSDCDSSDIEPLDEGSPSGRRHRTVLFHPHWSNGTAAVRGTKPLNAFAVHYWEVHISRRLFGTSLQFGVATKSARLHVDAFVNLLGEDQHSWALSHKGSLWHRGRCRQFVEPFGENESVLLGMLFDGPRGTLTYFKDGVSLGVAFTGLTTYPLGPALYPVISSTAAKTEMTLGTTLRSFDSLQDRCRATIVRHLANEVKTIDRLPIPKLIKNYIGELVDVGSVQHDCRPETHKNAFGDSHSENKQRRFPRLCLKEWPEVTSQV